MVVRVALTFCRPADTVVGMAGRECLGVLDDKHEQMMTSVVLPKEHVL